MKLTVAKQHAIGRGALLWLVSGRIPGSDDDTAQLVLAPSAGDARDTFTDYMINSSNIDEDTEEELRAAHGKVCYIITCEQIGEVERSKDDLANRLRDLAAGARSKADLIASGSPTSIYTKPVDVLRALAKEAEKGLEPDPDAGLEIQRTLVLSTAHMDPGFGLFLDRQVNLRAGIEQGEQSLIVDPIGEYGWRICLTDPACELYMKEGDADLRHITLPDDGGLQLEQTEPCALPDLIRFGQQHNCDWLAFDRDGPIVDGLPVYEWE